MGVLGPGWYSGRDEPVWRCFLASSVRSLGMAFQKPRASGGGGIRPVVYGLLNILPPQPIIARRGSGRTVAGQVLGGGEAGPGDHVAQDSPAKIVSCGRRDASSNDSILQNAVQGFRGEILVQPS